MDGDELCADSSRTSDRGGFEWTLPCWSTQRREESIRSEVFVVADRKWRLLLYPRGNLGAPPGSVSLYLDSSAEDGHFPLDKVDFSLVMHGTPDVTKTSSHYFTTSSPDWGFTVFVKDSELSNPEHGLLLNDTLSLSVDVHVVRHVDWSAYDSKKVTGFVGLKNQGATCYLNSLLQTLFHLTAFRKAVYELPTSNADERKDGIALALQSLFYKLQVSPRAVSTTQLTQSFGWDSAESFLQHDVQELSRVLCDKLEEKMKGTPVEGTMQALFEGHTTTFMECLDVPYRSSRKESFLDLQLDVRGCSNVLSSFERFVAEERLEGENAYAAEGFGLQRARKGVRFTSLPPVLQLQLKRFEYDPACGCMQKLNDRYEFPLELDLSSFVHAPPEDGEPSCSRYALHSVLVHSGGASGGHYYAYVRPSCAGAHWYCFDDDRVTRVDASCAVEDNFGDDSFDATRPQVYGSLIPGGGLFRGGQLSSAYMLVYVRIQDVPRVVCSHSVADIPERVRLRLEAEATEKARLARERDEAHMYAVVRVATDRDISERVSGKCPEAAFDLVDWGRLSPLRIVKHASFHQFRELAVAQFGVPVEMQRWWCWQKRKNGTFRPFRPISAAEADGAVGVICSDVPSWSLSTGSDLRLYLETLPAPCPTVCEGPEHALLFFKLYDPASQALSYCGSSLVRKDSLVGDLRTLCAPLAAMQLAAELLFFEEVKSEPVMIESVSADMTLFEAGLGHGDILVVQRALAPSDSFRHPLAPSFFSHLKSRLVLVFQQAALSSIRTKPVVLELSIATTIGEARLTLASELGVQTPTRLRFLRPHNAPAALRPFDEGEKLLSLLIQHDGTLAHTLMYEILEAPGTHKSLSVDWLGTPSSPRMQLSLSLRTGKSVADLLKLLVSQLCATGVLPPGFTQRLRLLQLSGSCVCKVVPCDETVDNMDHGVWRFRAEPVPADQLHVAQDERIVPAAHVRRDPGSPGLVLPFGEPFLLKLRADEPLESVKARVAALLGLDAAGAEFSSWRWGVVLFGRLELIPGDSHAVLPCLTYNQSELPDLESYLALEHETASRTKRSRLQTVEHSVRSVHNRQMRIYN